MKINYDESLKLVLVHEGGYVDHPEDPGGATNLGITQRTLSAYKGRSVSKQEVRKLNIATAASIYRKDYWDRARCDELPVGLDYVVFDGSVNSGVSRSVKWLQEIVGVTQDGVIGVHTFKAIDDYNGSTIDLIEAICARRMVFLKRLRHWNTFKNGWTRRVIGNTPGSQDHDIGVVDRGVAMVKGEAIKAPRTIDDGANQKANEKDVKLRSTVIDALKDKTAIGTAGTVITGVLTAGTGEGPVSYAIAAVLVIVALAGVIMVLRR